MAAHRGQNFMREFHRVAHSEHPKPTIAGIQAEVSSAYNDGEPVSKEDAQIHYIHNALAWAVKQSLDGTAEIVDMENQECGVLQAILGCSPDLIILQDDTFVFLDIKTGVAPEEQKNFRDTEEKYGRIAGLVTLWTGIMGRVDIFYFQKTSDPTELHQRLGRYYDKFLECFQEVSLPECLAARPWMHDKHFLARLETKLEIFKQRTDELCLTRYGKHYEQLLEVYQNQFVRIPKRVLLQKLAPLVSRKYTQDWPHVTKPVETLPQLQQRVLSLTQTANMQHQSVLPLLAPSKISSYLSQVKYLNGVGSQRIIALVADWENMCESGVATQEATDINFSGQSIKYKSYIQEETGESVAIEVIHGPELAKIGVLRHSIDLDFEVPEGPFGLGQIEAEFALLQPHIEKIVHNTPLERGQLEADLQKHLPNTLDLTLFGFSSLVGNKLLTQVLSCPNIQRQVWRKTYMNIVAYCWRPSHYSAVSCLLIANYPDYDTAFYYWKLNLNARIRDHGYIVQHSQGYAIIFLPVRIPTQCLPIFTRMAGALVSAVSIEADTKLTGELQYYVWSSMNFIKEDVSCVKKTLTIAKNLLSHDIDISKAVDKIIGYVQEGKVGSYAGRSLVYSFFMRMPEMAKRLSNQIGEIKWQIADSDIIARAPSLIVITPLTGRTCTLTTLLDVIYQAQMTVRRSIAYNVLLGRAGLTYKERKEESDKMSDGRDFDKDLDWEQDFGNGRLDTSLPFILASAALDQEYVNGHIIEATVKATKKSGILDGVLRYVNNKSCYDDITGLKSTNDTILLDYVDNHEDSQAIVDFIVERATYTRTPTTFFIKEEQGKENRSTEIGDTCIQYGQKFNNVVSDELSTNENVKKVTESQGLIFQKYGGRQLSAIQSKRSLNDLMQSSIDFSDYSPLFPYYHGLKTICDWVAMANQGYPAIAAFMAWLSISGTGMRIYLTESPLPCNDVRVFWYVSTWNLKPGSYTLVSKNTGDPCSLNKAVEGIKKMSNEEAATHLHLNYGIIPSEGQIYSFRWSLDYTETAKLFKGGCTMSVGKNMGYDQNQNTREVVMAARCVLFAHGWTCEEQVRTVFLNNMYPPIWQKDDTYACFNSYSDDEGVMACGELRNEFRKILLSGWELAGYHTNPSKVITSPIIMELIGTIRVLIYGIVNLAAEAVSLTDIFLDSQIEAFPMPKIQRQLTAALARGLSTKVILQMWCFYTVIQESTGAMSEGYLEISQDLLDRLTEQGLVWSTIRLSPTARRNRLLQYFPGWADALAKLIGARPLQLCQLLPATSNPLADYSLQDDRCAQLYYTIIKWLNNQSELENKTEAIRSYTNKNSIIVKSKLQHTGRRKQLAALHRKLKEQLLATDIDTITALESLPQPVRGLILQMLTALPATPLGTYLGLLKMQSAKGLETRQDMTTKFTVHSHKKNTPHFIYYGETAEAVILALHEYATMMGDQTSLCAVAIGLRELHQVEGEECWETYVTREFVWFSVLKMPPPSQERLTTFIANLKTLSNVWLQSEGSVEVIRRVLQQGVEKKKLSGYTQIRTLTEMGSIQRLTATDSAMLAARIYGVMTALNVILDDLKQSISQAYAYRQQYIEMLVRKLGGDRTAIIALLSSSENKLPRLWITPAEFTAKHNQVENWLFGQWSPRCSLRTMHISDIAFVRDSGVAAEKYRTLITAMLYYTQPMDLWKKLEEHHPDFIQECTDIALGSSLAARSLNDICTALSNPAALQYDAVVYSNTLQLETIYIITQERKLKMAVGTGECYVQLAGTLFKIVAQPFHVAIDKAGLLGTLQLRALSKYLKKLGLIRTYKDTLWTAELSTEPGTVPTITKRAKKLHLSQRHSDKYISVYSVTGPEGAFYIQKNGEFTNVETSEKFARAYRMNLKRLDVDTMDAKIVQHFDTRSQTLITTLGTTGRARVYTYGSVVDKSPNLTFDSVLLPPIHKVVGTGYPPHVHTIVNNIDKPVHVHTENVGMPIMFIENNERPLNLAILMVDYLHDQMTKRQLIPSALQLPPLNTNTLMVLACRAIARLRILTREEETEHACSIALAALQIVVHDPLVRGKAEIDPSYVVPGIGRERHDGNIHIFQETAPGWSAETSHQWPKQNYRAYYKVVNTEVITKNSYIMLQTGEPYVYWKKNVEWWYRAYQTMMSLFFRGRLETQTCVLVCVPQDTMVWRAQCTRLVTSGAIWALYQQANKVHIGDDFSFNSVNSICSEPDIGPNIRVDTTHFINRLPKADLDQGQVTLPQLQTDISLGTIFGNSPDLAPMPIAEVPKIMEFLQSFQWSQISIEIIIGNMCIVTTSRKSIPYLSLEKWKPLLNLCRTSSEAILATQNLWLIAFDAFETSMEMLYAKAWLSTGFIEKETYFEQMKYADLDDDGDYDILQDSVHAVTHNVRIRTLFIDEFQLSEEEMVKFIQSDADVLVKVATQYGATTYEVVQQLRQFVHLLAFEAESMAYGKLQFLSHKYTTAWHRNIAKGNLFLDGKSFPLGCMGAQGPVLAAFFAVRPAITSITEFTSVVSAVTGLAPPRVMQMLYPSSEPGVKKVEPITTEEKEALTEVADDIVTLVTTLSEIATQRVRKGMPHYLMIKNIGIPRGEEIGSWLDRNPRKIIQYCLGFFVSANLDVNKEYLESVAQQAFGHWAAKVLTITEFIAEAVEGHINILQTDTDIPDEDDLFENYDQS